MASVLRLPERSRRAMIRFIFFSQGGQARLDMVGAAGGMYTSRLWSAGDGAQCTAAVV